MTELHARGEELVSLKDQVQAFGMSIAKAVSDRHLLLITTPTPFHQEAYIGDLNIDFESLESTKSVDSAQAAAVTSYKAWLDIESVGIDFKINLFNSFFPRSALNEMQESLKTLKRERKVAFREYSNQGEPREHDHQTDLIQIC